MLTLDERLSAVLSEITLGDKVADIGCDHGKIANLAVQITKNDVYAVDISEFSLLKAKELSSELSQEENVHCIVGDGLKPLKVIDVDTIVIAGMGGHEIVKILDEASVKYRKYILVPHQHADILREYLLDKNFGIQKDYIIECANKFYPIIVVAGEYQSYSDFEIMFGKIKSPAQSKLIAKQKHILENIVKCATGESLIDAQRKLEIINNENK